MRVPLNGGEVTTLATQQNGAAALALDADNVYWTNTAPDSGPGSIMVVPKAGGVPVMLPGGPMIWPREIVLYGDDLYWCDGSGTINRMPKSGGTPVVLASGQEAPQSIAVDDVAVYWTNWNGGTLMRLAK